MSSQPFDETAGGQTEWVTDNKLFDAKVTDQPGQQNARDTVSGRE